MIFNCIDTLAMSDYRKGAYLPHVIDLAANSCLYFSGISFRTPLEVSDIVYQNNRFVTGSLSSATSARGTSWCVGIEVTWYLKRQSAAQLVVKTEAVQGGGTYLTIKELLYRGQSLDTWTEPPVV